MSRPPIGDRAMTPAERQRRRRAGARPMIALADMQQHAERLCADHRIAWHLTSCNAHALREFEEINAPPIRGAVSYATVLHEIGHILGRYQQSHHVMVLENLGLAMGAEKRACLDISYGAMRAQVTGMVRTTGGEDRP